jgi:protein-S-isoprenylcysteine O-methyltransferase Ste14
MLLDTRLVSGVIVCIWLVFELYWLLHARGNKKTVYSQSRGSRLLYLVLMFAVVLVVTSIPQLRIPLLPTNIATQVAGIILCAAGVVLAIQARRTLGANWSGIVTLKEDHTLVRRGPYRFVRHPIYSGILLAAAGSFLALLPTVQAVICLLFLLFNYRRKSLLEERILSQNFPDEYPQYCREVKALVPFIY